MKENNYTECYTAYMDILGFKNLIKEKSFQEILDIYQHFRNRIKKIYVGNEKSLACEIEAAKEVKCKVMSDSICFYIEADMPDALMCLMACCAFFQARLLALSPPVLVRGGITSGELYVDGDVVFGPALVEAYLLEDKCAKDPRIIIRKCTLEQGLKATSKLLQKAWSSIVLEDFDAFYWLNFNACFGDNEQESIVLYEQLSKTVNQKLSEETDESIRHKYLYLRNHIRYQPQEVHPNA